METNTHQIPVFNVHAQTISIRSELNSAIERVLDSGWYILGPEVRAFEEEFARYLGSNYCVTLANGTDAIAMALRSVGVTTGDHVVTVSHTATATVAAIEQVNAIPVLADIERETRGMCPESLLRVLTPQVKAIILVHMYGMPGKIDEIARIAKERGIALIEDCAQAHGSTYKNRKVGTYGDVAAFSFYPTKLLGALGDGGAIVTNSEAIAQTITQLRQYGWRDRYTSEQSGFNSRLDELQAAVLRVKLPLLDDWNQRRRSIAARYAAVCDAKSIIAPIEPECCQSAYHLFVVECKDRDETIARLAACGVGTAIHYPTPIHLQPAYQGRLRLDGALPNTRELYSRILSLPLFPELLDAEVDTVVSALRSICT